MKNIVLIIDSLTGGGAENMNVRLSELFLEKNYTVHLIILKNIINFDLNEKVNFITLDYKKKYFSLINKLVYANILKQNLNNIEKEHGKIDLVLGSLGLTHDLMHIINRKNFYFVLHGATTISKLQNKKGISKFFKKQNLKKIYNNKNIICVSDGVKNDILSLKIFPSSIQTIYNFFDLEKIIELSNNKPEIFLTNKYIIHVGRFAKVKRHDLLIKAFSLIKNKDILLVLVGEGEEQENIKILIKDLKISHRVIMTGFQNNPYPLIKNAEALVLSSDNEGFGNVLIESLIVGTIAISTDCPYGPKEILGKDYSQCLSKVNDAKELAICIDQNLASPPLIIKEYLSKFDKHTVLKQYENLFKN